MSIILGIPTGSFFKSIVEEVKEENKPMPKFNNYKLIEDVRYVIKSYIISGIKSQGVDLELSDLDNFNIIVIVDNPYWFSHGELGFVRPGEYFPLGMNHELVVYKDSYGVCLASSEDNDFKKLKFAEFLAENRDEIKQIIKNKLYPEDEHKTGI